MARKPIFILITVRQLVTSNACTRGFTPKSLLVVVKALHMLICLYHYKHGEYDPNKEVTKKLLMGNCTCK